MTSTTTVEQGLLAEDYGLVAIARHNAATRTEQFPSYQENVKGLGIYDGYAPLYRDEQSYIQNLSTPTSNTASEGMRTRSGRSTRPTDSPFSTNKSRVSKSPAPRKREKKSKVDKSKTPKLTAPLSVLTKDMTIPVRDIEAYVNRSAEERLREMEKKGYTSRPMNSFMLYRSAYAERTKAWCAQNNHQIVSSVSGESWPMEPEEIRSQFDEWAKTERQHHQEAHPNYKFSPSKSNNKRRKGEVSDDEEDERSDLDGDPDGEYRGGRHVRLRKQDRGEPEYLTHNIGFNTHPYYGHQVGDYEQSQYQYTTPGRPLPANIGYDYNGIAYNAQTNTYLPGSLHHQRSQYRYAQEMHASRVPTPSLLTNLQSLGGYGLPSGQSQSEDIFSTSRTSTPMQHYHSYGQTIHPQYHAQYPQQIYDHVPAVTTAQPGSQLYEHQQYLQQALQPQTAIDPGLEAAFEAAAASRGQAMTLPESHFDDAIGDVSGIHEYYGQSSSPTDFNATLAPTWSPNDLKK